MRSILIIALFVFLCPEIRGQLLPGFKVSAAYGEQQLVIENDPPGTRILVNAPLSGFGDNDKVLLVFYALPNGNSIEQTNGKKLDKGDDWHFDIQHIGAQTRFLRHQVKKQTIVTIYLETRQKSWPAWVAGTRDSIMAIKQMVDGMKMLFSKWHPQIVLNGHSGGGRFILSYIDAAGEIPRDVVRIAFLDSDYGYEDSIHGPKLTRWLRSGQNRHLCTLAYNDSVVVYNGKQLVSPTGGTWYRSKMMMGYLSGSFGFKTRNRDSLIWNCALKNRIEIILKTNPEKKIYHTRQVELNGFIHSMVSGTRLENKGYSYFGARAYASFISDSVHLPVRRLNIPPRDPTAEPGSAFMKRIDSLPLGEREEAIFRAVSSGNIPGFLRNTKSLKGEFADAAGTVHQVSYEVMPDYLAVGSDSDYCRIPVNPFTAQRIADLFGASLVTAKLSDHIYKMADKKMVPFSYLPVGNENEKVAKFTMHNSEIERQLADSAGTKGQLVAGAKKDVVLSSGIGAQRDRVVIYGWHKPGGKPIQPLYSGHVYWYVDYSHGIRLINNQVLLDNKPAFISDILKDPLLYKIFSNEDNPMSVTGYFREN